MNDYRSLLTAITLVQRAVQCEFKELHQLTSADIEIICFARNNNLFNIYQVRLYFKAMNTQQVIRTIKKLQAINLLETIRTGTKGKPAIYMLTENGNKALNDYLSAFNNVLN